MSESGISWPNDKKFKFNQVDGFVYGEKKKETDTCEQVLGAQYLDCKSYSTGYTDKPGYPVLTNVKHNTTYLYWYPNDIKTQYLYESYPSIINPIEGLKNEHFINWMRTAALPDFRKLYGRIDSKVSKGDR
jgi:hypothetical protein